VTEARTKKLKTDFINSYTDAARASAYSKLEFANTYYLAYRDLPAILTEHVTGKRALDFGCGTGRSTRFLQKLGFAVTGVDISEDMLQIARATDPSGDYRIVPGDDFSELDAGAFDLVLCAFTFDNIPGPMKTTIFRDLGKLLGPGGTILTIVSAPEIYTHEWASFTTRDFPENATARSGDIVRTVVTDHKDDRAVEDILSTAESYQSVYEESGLQIVRVFKPLAKGDEPYAWVNETTIAPWVIYVLTRSV
jgi:SAM-dependent methyltransferase